MHSLAHAWQLFGQTYWPPIDGPTLYRPLTMLLFAVEWVLGNGSPLPFHAANILLYAGACAALYRLVRLITDADVALVASALFAVHPVHTEAVANVVGQSELLVAIALFLAVERYIKARRSGNVSTADVATISALFLGGCLAKEHAIILPGLIAASELLINRGEETLRVRIRKAAPTFVCLGLVAVAFIVARAVVTGGLGGGSNELFGYQTYSARLLTVLTIIVEWLRLLFWPAQLSSDYSFPRIRVATVPDIGMLPGILVVVGCAVMAWRVRRSAPVITFAFLWIAVTLAIPSNLIMVTGFVLAERTLLLASAGVTLMVAVGVLHVWRNAEYGTRNVRHALVAAVALVIVCGIGRSVTRNPVWHDNETLFRQTVEDVPFSARAHFMLAEYLFDEGRHREAVDDMLLAVALGRKNDGVMVAFAADLLQSADMCSRAMSLYHRALTLRPDDEQLRYNASLCLIRLGKVGDARSNAEAGIVTAGKTPKLERMVVLTDSLDATRLSKKPATLARQ